MSRYIPPEDALYFEGTGYSKVSIDKPGAFLLISVSILSRSENGLLLYLENVVSVWLRVPKAE